MDVVEIDYVIDTIILGNIGTGGARVCSVPVTSSAAITTGVGSEPQLHDEIQPVVFVVRQF